MTDPSPFVLVICFDGGPITAFADDEETREFLADVMADNAHLYQVWSGSVSGALLQDRTAAFAEAWGACFDFAGGDDPDEFLSPFPPFVLAHQRDKLIADYRAAQEAA